jgi:hypothetical protein
MICHLCENETNYQLCGMNLCRVHQEVSEQDTKRWMDAMATRDFDELFALMSLDRPLLVPSIMYRVQGGTL